VTTPEQNARIEIDQWLAAAGWSVQNLSQANLHASQGVALREFPLNPGHGLADYLLYVDGKACGVVEAKRQGTPLRGVEPQSARYAQGPAGHAARLDPAVAVPVRIHRRGNPLHQRPGPDAARPRRVRLPPARDAGAVAEAVARGHLRVHGRTVDPRGPGLPPHRAGTPAAHARTRHRVGRFQALACADHRHPQPGSQPRAEQAACADPDGHRQRQDLHRHQLHLPADQLCRRAARVVPGGPRQPRPAGQEGVRRLRLALQQLQVRRGVHRPAPHAATSSTPRRASASAPSSGCSAC
jgi:hypothetical protein